MLLSPRPRAAMAHARRTLDGAQKGQTGAPQVERVCWHCGAVGVQIRYGACASLQDGKTLIDDPDANCGLNFISGHLPAGHGCEPCQEQGPSDGGTSLPFSLPGAGSFGWRDKPTSYCTGFAGVLGSRRTDRADERRSVEALLASMWSWQGSVSCRSNLFCLLRRQQEGWHTEVCTLGVLCLLALQSLMPGCGTIPTRSC